MNFKEILVCNTLIVSYLLMLSDVNLLIIWSSNPNEVDNNLKSQKSGLIELQPKDNLVSKNQRYWKQT